MLIIKQVTEINKHLKQLKQSFQQYMTILHKQSFQETKFWFSFASEAYVGHNTFPFEQNFEQQEF